LPVNTTVLPVTGLSVVCHMSGGLTSFEIVPHCAIVFVEEIAQCLNTAGPMPSLNNSKPARLVACLPCFLGQFVQLRRHEALPDRAP
jgi:hypothetical protein